MKEKRLLTHFIWADNVWLLASSSTMLKSMISSLTSTLNAKKLVWKSNDLKLLTTSCSGVAGFELETIHENFQSTTMKVHDVQELTVLGTLLTEKGSTIDTMEFRAGTCNVLQAPRNSDESFCGLRQAFC